MALWCDIDSLCTGTSGDLYVVQATLKMELFRTEENIHKPEVLSKLLSSG